MVNHEEHEGHEEVKNYHIISASFSSCASWFNKNMLRDKTITDTWNHLSLAKAQSAPRKDIRIRALAILASWREKFCQIGNQPSLLIGFAEPVIPGDANHYAASSQGLWIAHF